MVTYAQARNEQTNGLPGPAVKRVPILPVATLPVLLGKTERVDEPYSAGDGVAASPGIRRAAERHFHPIYARLLMPRVRAGRR